MIFVVFDVLRACDPVIS